MGKDKRQSEDAVLTKVTAWERETAQNEQLKKKRMMEAGCIQGGCFGHEAIDELCWRCGFWHAEDARRRELPLKKKNGKIYRDVSGRKPMPRRVYADSKDRQYGILQIPGRGWLIVVYPAGEENWTAYGKKQETFETQDQAQKALDSYARKYKWDEFE